MTVIILMHAERFVNRVFVKKNEHYVDFLGQRHNSAAIRADLPCFMHISCFKSMFTSTAGSDYQKGGAAEAVPPLVNGFAFGPSRAQSG